MQLLDFLGHKARQRLISFVLIASLLTLTIGLVPTVSQPTFAGQTTELPRGERWLQHLEKDLNPFWLMETAFGEPVGNFPTYRCNNGELLNLSDTCLAFSQLGPDDTWITENLDKDYIRMKSRQAFLYGVAYHLTGNPKFLSLAKAGVDWIRQHGLDQENGGAFTYFEGEDRRPGPTFGQRTSQDLAYTLQGLAFYYYLTRAPELLSDIVSLKDFIFENYYAPKLDMMMWIPQNSQDKGSENQSKELVSQLDQVNAYMLLLAPLLPEPYQSQWKQDLAHLSRIMMNQFYSPEYNVFWGQVNNPSDRELGTRHTDYGHSIKTFWMIYLTGKLVDNERFIDFARTNASRLLEEAYDSKSGAWARRPLFDKNGKVIPDLDKEWWIYAELDQMVATLALKDPSYADKYLKSTFSWWFDNMVDQQHHEVWHWRSWSNSEVKYPKQHLWKNGYHTYEHALIGYLVSQKMQGEPVKLYFARQEGQEKEGIRPYYYTGEVTELKTEPLSSIPALNKVTVTFPDIQ